MDQYMSEVCVDAPIPFLVGVGQSAARNLAANAHVVEFWFDSAKTHFDISETFAIGQLRERHAEKLIATSKRLNLAIPGVAIHTGLESTPWEEIHEL